MASTAPTPGLLYVTMQPEARLPVDQFHDWYNNEHGPNRLRLPCVQNGFRYRAIDLASLGDTGSESMPEWMACYDITDMDELTKDPYMSLRTDAVKSQREKDTMNGIKVDRRLFDLAGEKINEEEFVRLEDMKNMEKAAEGNIVVAVSSVVDFHAKRQVDEWYDGQVIPFLEAVPGWKRTRRYVTSTIEPREDGKLDYLALHEFAPKNGLGDRGLDVLTMGIDPWGKQNIKTRTYDLYYMFGAAPRHLSKTATWAHPDGQTRTTSSASGSTIESFITTSDGVNIPFFLEGSSNPNAPLIILSNSILVTWGIWDSFVSSFLSKSTNKQYRILRYLTRGRFSHCGTKDITVDLLASDIIALLDTLRVPKAALVIGVSLGGATALNVALKYPSRTAAFIACDTSAKSPAGNSKTWGDRVGIAEKEGAIAQGSGERIVGKVLAEMTVRRWFAKESFDGGTLEGDIVRVKEMIETNSLEGFKKSVQALFAYDLKEEMARYSGGKGAFLVGGVDGVLPGTMKEMAKGLGKNGGEYKVVEGAGHLPMVEKGAQVADFVTKFLA